MEFHGWMLRYVACMLRMLVTSKPSFQNIWFSVSWERVIISMGEYSLKIWYESALKSDGLFHPSWNYILREHELEVEVRYNGGN